MENTTQKVTIHSRKFYKVILEAIDPKRETPETFIMKICVRTRMTQPRAKLLVNHLPRIVRQSLSAKQANRLKAVLEDIGGCVRIESYLVTPGEGRVVEPPPRQEYEPDFEPDLEVAEPVPEGVFACPSCGSHEDAAARFCSFCHRRFRDEDTRPPSLEDRLPTENPLAPLREMSGLTAAAGWVQWVRDNPLLVAAAVVVLVLLILIIK